jgi:4-hydroxy-2-oxoheptanedioate aldolase
MTSRPHAIKHAIASQGRARGVHMTFAAPSVIELVALLDVDFIYIDGEHGRFDWADIEAACIAAERHGMTPVARVPDGQVATVTRFMDRGVKGIIVPHVNSADEARAVVDAAYYGPLGNRSFGGSRPLFVYGTLDDPSHLEQANAGMSVSIMIETREALDAAHEIAAVEGVDYLSFGMMDLAQSLGHPGNPRHPDVVAAVAEASERIRAAGKPVREDMLDFVWINDAIVAGTKALLKL